MDDKTKLNSLINRVEKKNTQIVGGLYSTSGLNPVADVIRVCRICRDVVKQLEPGSRDPLITLSVAAMLTELKERYSGEY